MGVNFDKKLIKLISGSTNIPKFNKKWAEILLKNILFIKKEEYLNYEDLTIKLKKNLKILGCIEKSNVFLENITAIKKLMESSISKINSIENIVKEEYSNLNNNLSLVILADYVREEYLNSRLENVNKIGVIPIFRKIVSLNICENIAVLTGKYKIVNVNLVPYLKEKLTENNIDNLDIFEKIEGLNNYVLINVSKKNESLIVKLVTECITLKKINITIGTVALLGEGWDAPSVNSLILASYVGSFMLSNQMRGRAIRSNNDSDKTANIWHLVSLSKIKKIGGYDIDLTDYYNLKRRFKTFVGIDYSQDLIQDGIERLSIINEEKLTKDYEKVNLNTLNLANNRKLMATRWTNILEKYGGQDINMVNKLVTSVKFESKEFITLDIKNMLLKSIIVYLIFIILEVFLSINSTYIIDIYKPIVLIIFIYYFIKLMGHINPVKMMEKIGQTVLNTMVLQNTLSTNKILVKVIVETVEVYQGREKNKVI